MILLAASLATCIPVDGEQITTRHSALAVPAFSRIEPARVIGLAPVPGFHRIISGTELARYLDKPEPVPELCFEYATRPPDTGAFLDAFREAVRFRIPESAAWRFELVDHSRDRVPQGPIRFSAASIAPNQPDGSTLARGSITYAGSRSFPVWLRVRIEVPVTRLFARRNLGRGQPIDRGDVEERSSLAGPSARTVTLTAAAAIGMTLVRDVRAGDPIESQTLRKPPEVVRGEAVSVEVVSGQARLSFTGRAEGSGRKGDRIAVSNPSTGRRFTALIRSRGAVEIAVDRKGVE